MFPKRKKIVRCQTQAYKKKQILIQIVHKIIKVLLKKFNLFYLCQKYMLFFIPPTLIFQTSTYQK